MEIEITENDSQCGSAEDNGCCPVALAYERATGQPCHVGFSYVYPDNNFRDGHVLPQELTEDIFLFVSTMGEHKIKPGKYMLKRREGVAQRCFQSMKYMLWCVLIIGLEKLSYTKMFLK